MEKTVEDVIGEIEKNNASMQKLLETNRQLAKNLKDRSDEEWDWVSVSTASKLWDISQAMIYQRINRGKLTTRRFGNKVYVSKKELKEICD